MVIRLAAIRASRPTPGLPAYRVVAGRNGAALPALFDSGALGRLASGALPQFERAALLDHSSAGLSGLGQLGFRQRDHGRPRPVAILATIGCSFVDGSGSFRADLPSPAL